MGLLKCYQEASLSISEALDFHAHLSAFLNSFQSLPKTLSLVGWEQDGQWHNLLSHFAHHQSLCRRNLDAIGPCLEALSYFQQSLVVLFSIDPTKKGIMSNNNTPNYKLLLNQIKVPGIFCNCQNGLDQQVSIMLLHIAMSEELLGTILHLSLVSCALPPKELLLYHFQPSHLRQPAIKPRMKYEVQKADNMFCIINL